MQRDNQNDQYALFLNNSELTGEGEKMTMTQKVSIIPNEGMYQDNDEFWFMGSCDKFIYKVNRNGMVEIVAEVPLDVTDEHRIYPRCIKKSNEIYCIPDKGKNILVYDLKWEKFKEIPIGSSQNKRLSIFNSWIQNDNLWCVSYGKNKILKINLNKFLVEKQFDVFEPKEQVGFEAIKTEESIYCISNCSTRIREFNLSSESSKTFVIECQDKGFNTIVSHGENVYLTGYLDYIYCWNKNSNQIKKYRISDRTFRYNKNEKVTPRFYRSACLKNVIVFIPYNTQYSKSNHVVYLDKFTQEINSIDLSHMIGEPVAGEHFVIECFYDNTLEIGHMSNGYIFQIDFVEKSVSKKNMKFNKEQIQAFWNKNGIRKIQNENELCELEDLFLMKKKDFEREGKREFGSNIWKKICVRFH